MRLAHIHLAGLTRYTCAAELQTRLLDRFHAHKADPSKYPLPDATILTAEFHPVYTCGRREIGKVRPEQMEYLKAGGKAEFREASRGGQTTFHGPGQLVAYPILDLKSHGKGTSPRDYVCKLEGVIIKTCRNFGIETERTEHTGVWTKGHSRTEGTVGQKKIAALGVHMRRNITSHGIGLNVNTDLWWFRRIVACGLDGRLTTSFATEGVEHITVSEAAEVFVRQMAETLDVKDIYKPYKDSVKGSVAHERI
ncbi:lipoyltransferase [Eremomyces bilateralis CBS 781.70]|uniref:Octanoyltransferase n=1 Tax=Eremomyces bilateralis CBS 781.70 TaxID=1392243 RepID=A0A6G1FVC8_9PEZI|nr:lipoyltransferase [Eremomyces bilateralis CBS 781.70]KAF1809855.1 lipoyltransferase [Eremomyces bilateralis CBS 781.70]